MDYLKLTEFYEQLEKTPKRLDKTRIISGLIKTTSPTDLEYIIPLLLGSVFYSYEESKIGVSDKIVIKALASSTGTTSDKVAKLWSKIGDLGEVAAELVKNKKQTTLGSRKLTVKKVFENVRALAFLEGQGSVERKLGLIKELITSAEPVEAKYITRLILEDLRIGIGEGVIRDSIVWGFSKNANEIDKNEYNELVSKVQNAIDMTNDFALIITTIKEKGFKGLDKLGVTIGKPFNAMLAIKQENAKDAADAVGLPCLVDYKLDGFRVLIHNDGKNIKLFTRKLEEVTKQFPDIVEEVKKIDAKNFIFDTEILGIDLKTKKYLPFQHISQRIRRKHGISEMVKKIPVVISVFDILYKNGESLLKKTQAERREILEKTIKKKGIMEFTNGKIAKTVKDIEDFYKESLKAGNEGIMVKSLEKTYTPGRKVGGWVKLKPVLESLDLVIVKAEWGTGKRAGSLTSFTIACDNNGKIAEIGKVSTGLKEKGDETTYNELTKILKPLIIEQKGKVVTVKPKVVIEVAYEEIQKSISYDSGYALRFPRFIRLREDKGIKEINNINDVERIYKSQRGQKHHGKNT